MRPEQNPEHWKWGIFYYNKDDKRIFPPKHNPAFGWTVNFANPKSVLVLILMLVAFYLLVYFIESKNS